MSLSTHRQHHAREPLIGGIALVIIGSGLLLAQLYPDFGRYIVLLVGLAVLALFLATRNYGALVAGSIISGVGVGVVFTQLYEGELGAALLLVSLGTGFVAIWALSYLFNLAERHWWPLIPGGIIATVGAALWAGNWAVDLLAWWPAVLIAIGLVLLISYYVRREGDRPA
ncbi:MAG TPA: hypothetical protein VH741_08650 [Candidatus Limnocylindrales bacterium]|jgi:hypothetical protein